MFALMMNEPTDLEILEARYGHASDVIRHYLAYQTILKMADVMIDCGWNDYATQMLLEARERYDDYLEAKEQS